MTENEPPAPVASAPEVPQRPIVLAFTGMPASGKGEAVNAARMALVHAGPDNGVLEQPPSEGQETHGGRSPAGRDTTGTGEPHLSGELPVVRMGDLIWERCRELGLELTPENVGRVANQERQTLGPEVWAKATVARIRELLKVLKEDATQTPDDVASRRTVDMKVDGTRNDTGSTVANGGAHASSSSNGSSSYVATPRPRQPVGTDVGAPALPSHSLSCSSLPSRSSPPSQSPPPSSPPSRSSPPAAIIDGLRSPAELAVFKEAFGERLRVIAIIAPSSVRASRIGSRGRVDDTSDPTGFQTRDRRELDWGLDKVIEAAQQRIVNDGTLEELRSRVRALVRDLIAS